MSMTVEQIKSGERFVNNAKSLLARAKNKNHTAFFYNKLMASEKKAICTLGNIDSRTKLTAQHIEMKFEEMSYAEKAGRFPRDKTSTKVKSRYPVINKYY
ncbi:Uncharacterised protein [Serratia marcescens]|uniref:Uncharacterized protein n=1 Tax=Serratia marcescens TaxID=615 RepID=A0A380A043_SERMA|nr:Uncharacterised protein [Serratia marcescens]